ncbi:MAG: hypothetical protein J6P46_02425 [Bacteroidales bacterium]|nr:hypothetical protein [Bacteroidales bacterium]
MKQFVFSIFAILAVISCTVEPLEPFDEGNLLQSSTAGPIVFDLQANHPDIQTKAVKSGWEAGDAIFVFFSNVSAPKYLKMSYDGSAWATAEYNGDTATPGALGLENGNTGTMRAVFLPFGSNATVSASGTSFVFNKTDYAYYLTATLDYTVAGNKVTGAFDMTVPDNYVQFFVEDAGAADEAYSLGCDAVIPVGVASISADGTVNETTNKTAADDMPGYAYSGGYLFSGKINAYYSYGSNYYFAKTKADGTERHDYYVTGKTLSSHSSVKLPANGDSKWQAVGSDKLVQLTDDDYISGLWWHTCNYGQSVPEARGSFYTFSEANSLGVSLPTKAQFESINNSSNCSYTWLSIHGQQGAVVKAERGFLFFPSHDNTNGSYWSSTRDDDNNYAWSFYFSGPVHTTGRVVHINTFPARPVTVRPEAIDLGLPSGTKWANMNVGASSKTEYGDYFAWGETTGYNSGKTNFSWSTYFDTSDGGGSFSKYYNGEKTELDLDNDAAYQNWGSHWRMPSKEQCEELINSNYTTVTWTTVSGVNGRLITSKSNTNSIFIPALSNCDGNGIRTTLSGNWGYCWTRTLTSTDTKAWYLTFSSSSIWVNSEDHRAYGLPVRAVWVE